MSDAGTEMYVACYAGGMVSAKVGVRSLTRLRITVL